MKLSVRLLVLVRMSPTWSLAIELVLVLNLVLVASVLTARRAWKMSALAQVLAPITALGLAVRPAVAVIPTNGGK